MEFILFFLAAILLDLLFGDPRWYPHPVRLIGWLCTFFETRFRQFFSKNPFFAGVSAAFSILTITAVVLLVILFIAHFLGKEVELVFAVLLFSTTIAIRDLLAHSHRVYLELGKKNNLVMARRAVSMIVGRDTVSLNEEGVIRACVETVAENMADGIVAPIFWAMVAVVIHGVVPQLAESGSTSFAAAVLGAFLYKACNTMDSMYGYKNERYLYFGCFAARLDDLMNYLPARITAGCLVAAAPLSGLDCKGALRIVLRDNSRHSSPNAGYPEAAMAGALGVQLGGAASYFGKTSDKPKIGDSLRPLARRDISRANRIVCCGSALFIGSCCLFYIIFATFFP